MATGKTKKTAAKTKAKAAVAKKAKQKTVTKPRTKVKAKAKEVKGAKSALTAVKSKNSSNKVQGAAKGGSKGSQSGSAPITRADRLRFERLITPLEDRLIVRMEGVSETTAGGIIIPGTVHERPHRGEVLAIGRGRRNKKGQVRPLDVNVGDHVLFPEFAGTKLALEGEEVLILREEEVLGIVT
ncbi:MAG: co-chaperone GroES [Bdellovibrionales bacterium]